MRCEICDVVFPLTDTPGTGLTFGSVTNAGAYVCSASGNLLTCNLQTGTLPSGTAPGRHVATCTATANNHATTGSGCADVNDCVVIIPVHPGVRAPRTADRVGPVAVRDTSYNTALGIHRARAVYEALIERLILEVRSEVRVEAVDDPKAPVQASHQQATRSSGS